MQPSQAKTQPAPVRTSRPTHVRHVVLGLTVAAYMITYMDRQILAVARPVIRDELGISLVMMGWITFGFRMAYALFQIPGGWLGDRFGARRALTAVVTWWSVFTALTGLAWNAVSMLTIQVFFGLGEAGAFPIATRSLSHWLRPTERGFAQGVTHAGSRLGSALTPLVLAGFTIFGLRWTGIIPDFGWRAAFFFYGILGVIWSAVWFFYYRNSPEEHAGVNQAERDLIGSGRQRSTEIPWRKILSHGNLWILAVMYFCYNFNLNVYQDWFPTYLHDSRGMTLAKMGIYASLPLFAGSAGRSGRRLVFGQGSEAHRQRKSRPALGRDRRIRSVRRGQYSGDLRARPQGFCRLLLRGVLRPGMDRRHLVGRAARYRRGLCGLRLRCDEHAWQYRRSSFGRRSHLRRHALRLEFTVPDHERVVSRRRGFIS